MILSKTSLGLQVFKDRSVSLTPPQRSALILIDGKRSVDEVLKMTAAVGVTMADVEALIALGLIQDEILLTSAPSSPSSANDVEQPVIAVTVSSQTPGIDFHSALNQTILICSNLGFKGFGLNMALADVDSIEKLQKLAPEIRRVAGEAKYAPLHKAIFGKPL